MSINIIKNSVRATGGTQSDEFKAAIKSVTSSTDVGAVFLYDTSQDSDGGKWRKGNRCKGLSWFDEPTLPAGTGANQYNSATRSARSEFPAMALIVADNVGNHPLTNTVSIYDLDDPSMPLWLQFTATSQADPYHDFWRRSKSVSAVTALNGRVYFSVGGTTDQAGVKFADFTSDRLGSYGTATSLEWSGYFSGGIADRNSDTKIFLGNTLGAIVHRNVNDVAATVLEGAEIGALGLPIPTVCCGTNGGVSVIQPSGSVYNITNGSGDSYEFAKKLSIDGNILAFDMDLTSSSRDGWWLDLRTLYANTTVNSATNAGGLGSFSKTGESGDIIFVGNNVSALAKDAIGTEAGLSVYKLNEGNPAESAVAYITSLYNTGYMVGDIRGAWLAGHHTLDRSVKANTLTHTGSVTATLVAADAEQWGYSGFSASNYLSKAHDADFDFGTGDFSIMFWVKSAATGGYEDYISRGDATVVAGDWLLQKTSSETLAWYRGTPWGTPILASTKTIGTSWTQVAAVRRGGKFNWYFNGEFDSSATDANSYTPSGGSALVIGRRLDASYPASNASLALLRISATAPTPAQIKAIFDEEKVIFRSGAKCLLQSKSAFAPNVVLDLAYDKSTQLLTVAQYANAENSAAQGIQKFRGLEMVDQLDGKTVGWTEDSAYKLATSGGVTSAYHSDAPGGVLVDLPALDVRAELNEGDDKLPDDGKFHFSGVTTDATQTVIGNIPVAEDENIIINARVTSKVYKFASYASHYEDVSTSYQREIGGNVAVSSAFSNPTHSISDNNVATMDVVLAANTSNNTVEIKVTGAAYRIEWTASVEVQRISDKLYER